MMFVAKCPLRISLVGGSTDQEDFIKKYGKGSVISFPSNLFAYISVHDNNRGKYIINYSRKEEVDNIDEIQNDVARVCLKHFNMRPVTITFNTDILATGSGLASSTAYTIALVKVLSMYKKCNFTEYDTCELALKLERQFNPLTGYQDPYGCGVGGFKRMNFYPSGKPAFTFLGSSFLQSRFNMALYHTGVSRSSTKILTSIDLDKSLPLLYKVDWMQEAIRNEETEKFLEIFKEGWEAKKKTSKLILEDKNLQKLDREFEENEKVLAVKLCGAGGGGYFFALCDGKYTPPTVAGIKPIHVQISNAGVVGVQI
jgi:D-glycero-alpha-D-manno-heptose-7-phosphate kinase